MNPEEPGNLPEKSNFNTSDSEGTSSEDGSVSDSYEIKNEEILAPDDALISSFGIKLKGSDDKKTSTDSIEEVSDEKESDSADQESTDDEDVEEDIYLAPDEMLQKTVGGKLNIKPGQAAKIKDSKIPPTPPPTDQASTTQSAGEPESTTRKRIPLERIPDGIPVLDKLESLLPSSLVDQEAEQEVFKPLDLGPLLKKKDIESPFELLAPDEIETQEEFVSKALPIGHLVKNRYKILKVISEKRDRASYLVRDLIKEKKFILKEIHSSQFTPEELMSRCDKFLDNVRILNTFKHNNLAEVHLGFSDENREYYVMERVEGLDLQKLSDMNTKPFTEKEVLKWARELCDAVEFLHHRPTPFTLGNIQPSSIMVNIDGTIKITNYDLQRFFDAERTLEFMPDDPKHLYSDITNLARVFYFLLTKRYYDNSAFQFEWPDNVSTEMRKLLEITCAEGQKTYGDIREFKARLDFVQSPQKTAEIQYKRSKIKFPIHKLDFSWINNLGRRVASQRPFMIAIELLLILFLIFLSIGVKVSEKTYSRPTGPLIYVSISDELLILRPSDFERIHRIQLPGEISYTYSLKMKVFNEAKKKEELRNVILVSYVDNSIIEVIDSATLTTITSFGAVPDIRKIIYDEEGKKLFALSRSSSQLCIINLDTLRIEKIIPVGMNPSDMTYIPLSAAASEKRQRMMRSTGEDQNKAEISKDSTPDLTSRKTKRRRISDIVKNRKEDLKKIIAEKSLPAPMIAVVSFSTRKITFIDVEKGVIKNVLEMEGEPSSLITSPDNEYLLVTDSTSNSIHRIKVDDYKLTDSIKVSGTSPSEMIYDKIRNMIWVSLRETNKIEGIRLSGGESRLSGFVGISPGRLLLDDSSDYIWVLNERSKDIGIVQSRTGKTLRKIYLYKTPTSILLEPGV
jgi:serine/threonine protein kinase